MEYNDTYNKFIEYLNKCRNIIKNTFFTTDDMFNLDKGDGSRSIQEIVREHRLKMIDIKLDHTMRMIEQIININNNLGFKVDLALVIKVAVLYHDIGRFRQSTWSNSFNDEMYMMFDKKFNNHGEDGYDIFLNNDFLVDDKFIPVIGKTILRHQNYHEDKRLNYKYDDNLGNIDINSIVTGNFDLNDSEWKITSLIVQLVADIDKSDILYQHLSDDFEMIKDYVFDKNRDSLDNMSSRWGISKKEILEYNGLTLDEYKGQVLKIPIKNVSIDKLQIPQYMREMFYNNSWLELREMKKDLNWNFVSVLWWRLSHFLNSVSFNSTLANIEETKLLEQIYEKIPDRLKPLFTEAFEYAKEELVNERLKINKGNIYLLER